jgi:hypothetical protein
MRLFRSYFIVSLLAVTLATPQAHADDAVPTVPYPFDNADAIPGKPENWRGASVGEAFQQTGEDAVHFYEQFISNPFGECVNANIYPECMCIKKSDLSCWAILIWAPKAALLIYLKEIALTPLRLFRDVILMVAGGTAGTFRRSCFWPMRSYSFPMTAIETNQLWTQSQRIPKEVMELDMSIKNRVYYSKEYQASEQYQGLSTQLALGTDMPPLDEQITGEAIKDLETYMPEHRRYLVQSIPGTQLKAHSNEIPQYLFRNVFSQQKKAAFFHVHHSKGGIPFSTGFFPFTIYSQSVIGSFMFPESVGPTVAGLVNAQICSGPEALGASYGANFFTIPPWERICLNSGLGRWAPLTDKTDVIDSDIRAGVVALLRGAYTSQKILPSSYYKFKYGKDSFQLLTANGAQHLQDKCYKSFEMPAPFFGLGNLDEYNNEGISFGQWTNFKGCGDEGLLLTPGGRCNGTNSE